MSMEIDNVSPLKPDLEKPLPESYFQSFSHFLTDTINWPGKVWCAFHFAVNRQVRAREKVTHTIAFEALPEMITPRQFTFLADNGLVSGARFEALLKG